MSEIRVNTVTNGSGDGAVKLPNSATGVADGLKLAPKVISFSPENLGVGAAISSNIVITFDQDIQFYGTPGTVEIREETIDGLVYQSYTTGSSSELSISGAVLTINPSVNLEGNGKYFIKLPSVGIANTYGNTFSGLETYSFTTETVPFSMTGGNHSWTSGGYKYHVFTSSGPLVVSSPSVYATNLTMMLVGGGGGGGSYPGSDRAGGGGGGGGLVKVDNIRLRKGNYSVAIGGGGSGHRPTSSSYGQKGTNSSFSISGGDDILVAYGGGGGVYESPLPAADGGSGGGSYSFPSPTRGEKAGYGFLGQGNPGVSYGNMGYNPNNEGFAVGGGGGGAGSGGGSYNTHQPTPNPYGFGLRGGGGGSGRSVPEFRSPNLSGYVPTIPPHSLSVIGPTGRYAGGGGGGASPSGYIPSNPHTGGVGGQGGGGHGATVNPSYSTFGGPQMTPGSPNPYWNGPTNWAQPGFYATGGGGGGNRGPYGTYRGGDGGQGVFMIRYSA